MCLAWDARVPCKTPFRTTRLSTQRHRTQQRPATVHSHCEICGSILMQTRHFSGLQVTLHVTASSLARNYRSALEENDSTIVPCPKFRHVLGNPIFRNPIFLPCVMQLLIASRICLKLLVPKSLLSGYLCLAFACIARKYCVPGRVEIRQVI